MTDPEPSEAIEILLLADRLGLVPKLGRRAYEWWPEYVRSVEQGVQLFERCSNRDCIPMALVALRRGKLVGTVSLLERSVDSHPHLAPWVAGLYVTPEARHCGIATSLVAAAGNEAGRLGYHAAYIGISSARAHYERQGWEYLDMGWAGDDRAIVLMRALTTRA